MLFGIPIYTQMPNLKGLIKLFFKSQHMKGNYCSGGMAVLKPKYPFGRGGGIQKDANMCTKQAMKYANTADSVQLEPPLFT